MKLQLTLSGSGYDVEYMNRILLACHTLELPCTVGYEPPCTAGDNDDTEEYVKVGRWTATVTTPEVDKYGWQEVLA